MRRRARSLPTRPLQAVALLVVVLAAALTVPGAAGASAAPNPNYHQEYTAAPVPGQDYYLPLGWDFEVGDCIALSDGSYVALRAPDTASMTYLTWRLKAKSTHPSHDGDVWHGTFYFLDHSGNTVLTFGPLDGPQMRERDRVYYSTSWSNPIHVNYENYLRISLVIWKGEC